MGNKTALKQHFPMLRDREEILQEITKSNRLSRLYATWVPECKEEFLDFCTGARGMKILYDSFFKEALNCEYDVGRLEFFLSTVLKRKVKILKILPNDSTRIADETSLLITDIVVELEAWMTFLGSDSPERIIELITAYPQFKAMYETLYSMCLNTERVMEMFSEELRRLDRNTVKYMIDEQQKQIDEQQQKIDEQIQTLQKQIEQLNEQNQQLDAQRAQLSEQNQQLDAQKAQLSEQNQRLDAQRAQLSEQNQQLDAQKAQLSEQNQRLDAQKAQLSEQNQRLDAQKAQLSEQNQQLDAQKVQLSEQNQQLDAQKAQLKDKDLEIEALRKRIAELEK